MHFPGRKPVKHEPRGYPAMAVPSRSNAIRREAPRPRPPMAIERRPDARVLQYSREQRDWSTDIFDCVDPCHGPTCVQATFCPCALYANNRRRFEHLESKGYPHPTLSVTRIELRQALLEQEQQQRASDYDSHYDGHPGGGRQHNSREEEPGCFCTEEDSTQDPRNQHSRNHHDHDERHDQGGRQQKEEGESDFVSPHCITYGLGLPFGLAFGLQAIFRGRIRKRYHIRGEVYEDGLAAVCCAPCSLVQESREIEAEERTFVLKPVDPPKSSRPRRMFTL